MIPIVEQSISLTLPSDINVWMSRHEDKIVLNSDAVKSPYIEIYPTFIEKGDWILWKDNKVIKLDGNRREIIKEYDSKLPLDVVYMNEEIMPVYKGLRGIVFNGEKYTSYFSKYGFKVFTNDIIKIITPEGKEVELDKPIHYRIFNDYVSVVYRDFSLTIGRDGSIKKYKKPAVFLASTSIGDIYQTLNGRIISDSLDYDLLGVCSSDVHFLGESYSGIFISCEGKVKYFYKGGWSYLGQIYNNLQSSDVNRYLVVLTNGITNVYSYDLKKIYSLKNIRALKLIEYKIVALSRTNRIYIVSPNEDEGLITVQRDTIGYKIEIRDVIKGEVILGQKAVETRRNYENNKLIIHVEPYLMDGGQVEEIIKVVNEIYEYEYPIKLRSEKLKLSIKDLKLNVALHNGKYVKDESSNAVLKGTLVFDIPTNLRKMVSIRVRNKEISYELTELTGEINFELPFYKIDDSEEVVQVRIHRGSKVEEVYEFTVKPKFVEKKGIRTVSTYIEDSKKIRVEKIVNGDFIWEKREEHPDFYNVLVIGKAGEFVNIEGNNVQVTKGRKEIEIKKSNIKRKYIIYGFENPVKVESAEIVGENLCIYLRKNLNNVVVVGMYGTQITVTDSEKLTFKLEPTYDTVSLLVNLGGIQWNEEYKLLDLFKKVLFKAVKESLMLKEEIETFGVL
jgi:hypothetical protein